MDWGDIPAWAAFVLAAVATVISVKARSDGKRAADAAEGALALQRAEAEERREAARPRAEFTLERRSVNAFTLRNVGSATAEGVSVLADGLPPIVREVPRQVSLQPGVGHDFTMAGSSDGRVPTHIRVVWDGQEEPVALPVQTYP
ncbi:hypothetical protein ACFV3E_24690 [Streptomyces sp. NPDC059718]